MSYNQICRNQFVTICITDLEKIGQGHGVKLLQWCHLLENTKIYKSNVLQFCASSHHFLDNNIWNIWPCKSKSRVMKYYFHNGATRWQKLKSIKVMGHIFELALTDSAILTCEIYDHEKCRLRQVQLLKWHHPKANIKKSIKVISSIFELALTISEIIVF